MAVGRISANNRTEPSRQILSEYQSVVSSVLVRLTLLQLSIRGLCTKCVHARCTYTWNVHYLQECEELRLSREETESLTSLHQWLRKLQRDSSTDDEDKLDDSSRAYLHSFRDNFTRYSLFLVLSLARHSPTMLLLTFLQHQSTCLTPQARSFWGGSLCGVYCAEGPWGGCWRLSKGE